MKNLISNQLKFGILCGFLLLLINQSCAPVYSELQSARTVGEKNIELTPSYSSVNFNNDGETNGAQNQIGLQAAYGITDKIDMRVRYERVWPKEDGNFGDGIDVIALGPKFGLVKDKVALYLPVGRALGEETSDTWEFQPTLFLTLPAVEDKVDLTVAPKYLFIFCEDCDNLVAVNFGASFSNDLTKWAVRPEFGLLYNPGEEGHFSQFSIGFSYTFGTQTGSQEIPEQ